MSDLEQIPDNAQLEQPLTQEELIWKSTEGREHFSTLIPGHQIAWDSTSLGELKMCPRSYFYSHILGLRSRKEAIPLTFGIHYHAALELYDRLIFRGADHDQAVHLVVKYLAKVCRVPVDPEAQPRDPKTGEFEGPGKLWNPDDPKNQRNSATLIRAVVWYLEHFKDDPLQTLVRPNGDPMVELSFRMELDSLRTPEGKAYLLCGHMDRVARFAEVGIYVADRKTSGSAMGSRFFDGFSPDNQMSLYTFAAKVVLKVPAQGVIIDGCQLGVNFARFQRGFAHRSQNQVNEWVEDLGYWLGTALRYAEQQHWPHNDKACGMYGGCKYRGICSRDPATRASHLNQGFERKPWNPLESR